MADDPIAKRVDRLEDRVGELERKERQRVSDWHGEKSSLLDAVKRFVDNAMSAALEPFKALPQQVSELKSVNDQQLGLLREAAEERGRRKQREEDAETRRKDSGLNLEAAKLDADLQKAQVDARVRRAIAIASVIGTLGAALIAAVAAAIASHH